MSAKVSAFGGFDDEFPADQFADLSTFSSSDTVSSFSSPPPAEKKVSNTLETPKEVITISKEHPSPLIHQLALALVARMYEVALILRDHVEGRLVKNCLHARNEVPAFTAKLSEHVDFTLLQTFNQFADEKRSELDMVWAQYSLYKRTKPKAKMNKRQFGVVITHWLTALAALESSTTTKSETSEVQRESPIARGPKTLFGFGKAKEDKPQGPTLRANKEVLQELHQMCLFGASTLLPHVDLVVDACWERLYLHDASMGLTPRGDPSAPEGCQAKFALNVVASLYGLKYRFGAQTDRRSKTPVLIQCYDLKLQQKHAADRQKAYQEHLARTGLL